MNVVPIDDCRVGDSVLCVFSGLQGRAGQIFEIVEHKDAHLGNNKYPLQWLKQMELYGDRFERMVDEKFSYVVVSW